VNPHAYLICVQGTTKLGYTFSANFIRVTSKRGIELAQYFTEEVKKEKFELPQRTTILGIPDPHKDEVESVMVTSVVDCGEEENKE
jgi:hypothetical protein